MERKATLKAYSLSLFDVLDKIGASEYIRYTRRNAAATQEILMSIVQNAVASVTGFTHIFGSSAEGTSTPGFNSDIDTVVSAAQPIVVEKLSDTKETPCLLMIQDGNTPPGYTKLQLVKDGTLPPDWVLSDEDEFLDLYGRPVIKNNSLIDAMTYDVRNGPAGTTLNAKSLPELDYVPAYRCKKWPSQANAWLIKHRPYSFPSINVSEDFKKYGFFVVSVGQPSSLEKGLEWRISFSIQERKMMTGLNSVQFKCYIAMKMIKNEFIKPKIAGKSLTSYHCKTCLLYTLEQTNPTLFVSENLVACLMKCMSTLVTWLTEGFIPNYFIPSENMWKGSKGSRLGVARILRDLLNDCPAFLTSISSDCMGAFLSKELLRYHHDMDQGSSKHGSISEVASSSDKGVASNVNNESNDGILIEDKPGEENEDDAIVDAIVEALTMDGDNTEKIEELKTIFPGAGELIKNIAKRLTEEDSTQTALDTTLPNVNIPKEMHDETDAMLIQQKRKVDVTLYKWHYWTVDYVFKSAKELIETTIDKCELDHCIEMHRTMLTWLRNITDLSPRMEFSKLDFQIVKEYLFAFVFTSLGSQLAAKAIDADSTDDMQGYLEESDHLLEMGRSSDALSGKVKHAAILFMQGHNATAEQMLTELDEGMENHVATWGRCYIKEDNIHEELCNRMASMLMSTQEMVQDGVAACVTYMPTEINLVPKELKYEMYRSVFATTPRDKHESSWFDFAVIDAKVYMYYLRYKIYGLFGDKRSQRARLLFLTMTLEHELNLGHPETAQNIVGCLLKDQGHLSEAWEAFMESWMLRPDHNAAKWHACIMVAEAVSELMHRNDNGDGDDVGADNMNFVEVLYQREI